MSTWTDVCALTDINLDTGVCALVNDQQVAIFRPASADTLFAVGNFDPIGEANVLSRGLISDIKGQLTVASPLYKQHYVLASGECLEDDSVSIPTFEVKVEGDRVLVAA
ncbi:MAG: nitrite reductase small subunit NirD [Bermanella sp.]